MDNVGEVMTANVAVPVRAPDISIEPDMAEDIGGSLEPIEQETPEFNSLEPQIDQESQEEVEDDISELELNDEEVELDRTREELEEVKEDENDDYSEEEKSIDDELALISETIRLLEIQRDALREQLGGNTFGIIVELVKFFIQNSITEEPISDAPNMPAGPSEAWKESARTQLRKIEVKISDLKMLRKRLVAKNKS
jgi:hypothetical protein